MSRSPEAATPQDGLCLYCQHGGVNVISECKQHEADMVELGRQLPMAPIQSQGLNVYASAGFL